MSRKIRFWFHAGQWRIQDHRQITTRDGVQDAWESRRDEQGHVMMFATEEQARAYLQESNVESENKS